MKKIYDIKNFDPIYRKEIIKNILNVNIDNLTDKQIKMLYEIFLENLRDGLKTKDAMGKAFEIVTCFKI